jgi:rod shape determining protein RodA
MTMIPRTVINRRNGPPFDIMLVLATMLVALVGVVMVYTATRGILLAAGDDPHTYLKKQALFVVLGVVVMALVAIFDGPLELQPSEFAVVGLVLLVAAYCDRRQEEGLAWLDVLKLLILAGIPIGLVLIQPDLGTAIIMMIVLLVMLAVAGLPIRILVLLVLGVVALAVLAYESGVVHAYQLARLTTFLNPNSTSTNPNVVQAIYNITESKTAIGSGGFVGTGLLHGAQTNLGYVPEQSTDFIFTAVGEQLGFVGAVGLLALLGLIAWRVLHAAGRSRDIFGRLVCTGLFTFVAFSVFQNAGMTMGIMPITGIPLPFVSYGGTAVIAFFLAVGLALSVGARRRKI